MPFLVVLDTLSRSLIGDEPSGKDNSVASMRPSALANGSGCG
jgi:hypothetical protein